VANDTFSDKRPGQAAPHPGQSLAVQGGALYQKMQCVACHGNPSVAPPLDGLYGRTVSLSDGGRVKADDVYLYESIVSPKARVVAGYTPIMPSFEGELSPEEINAVIEFIKSMPGRASNTGEETRAAPISLWPKWSGKDSR
jgi:cytochrome c oxidase subunit 2